MGCGASADASGVNVKLPDTSAAAETASQTSRALKVKAASQLNRPRVDWKELDRKLPADRSEESKKKRDAFFSEMDKNGNGHLSLAETDLGLRTTLGVENIAMAPKAVKCAFDAARKLDKNNSQDWLQRNEFRVFLLMLRQYFDLYQHFEEIDTGDDLRIDIFEFRQSKPTLEKWGIKVDNLDVAFAKIDVNGGGQILFGEFAEWALAQNPPAAE